jgi:hypothetical protein
MFHAKANLIELAASRRNIGRRERQELHQEKNAEIRQRGKYCFCMCLQGLGETPVIRLNERLKWGTLL